MSNPLPRERAERLGWARAVGVLDLHTGEFVELYSPDQTAVHFPEARREALRKILVAGATDVVAGLLVPEAPEPTDGASSFRETLLQDRSGFLFGKLLRDGRLLVVATEPAENPGRIWAQIKVLIPALNL